MEESLRITQFSFENAPIGIYRIGPDFNIIEANKAAARSLGYTKNKLATLSVFDINPQAKREDADVFWHSLKDSKDDNFETILCRKDGHQIPVQITSKFLTYGDQEYSICFSWDITERKKYMEQLRQLRNYLANIIDSMPSVLVGVDCDGRITQWNRRAEQVTGMLSSHVLAKPLDSVITRLSDQIALIKTAIQERRVIRSPKVMRKEEQDTRFEDITIYPLKANGVEGAVVRVDDITDQVRLEEMMIQSEKMLSVGGMAAGMAHEINNPLAGILLNAFVLKNRLTNAELLSNRKSAERYGITMEAIGGFMMDRGISKMLDAIQQSGQRAAEIVTNMLSFARKSENVISSQPIGTLLDQVLDLLQTDYDMKKHYDFKNVRIVREYDPNIPPVPCEASKIQQVFMNILKNGAEAMAEAEKPAIFVLRIKADGRWVRVEIDDNGPGMDEITRRRIFEPFFTTKPIGKGTGLGMSVSYFIITEDHGGEMSVHDADDGGTRFIIRLPMRGKKPASGK
jgi:PAS domain S-box-containing protein